MTFQILISWNLIGKGRQGDHPEIDTSEEMDVGGISKYQSLMGSTILRLLISFSTPYPTEHYRYRGQCYLHVTRRPS
jgi:hypothetical protein